MTVSVADRLLATKLFVSKWSGEASVPKVAREAEDSNNARRGTVRASAKVFESDELKAVLTEMAQLYAWWRGRTAPWRDGGWRVLMADQSMQFMEEAGDRIAVIEQKLLPALYDTYPAHLEVCKLQMGALFTQVRYPEPNELARRFAIKLSYEAVPSATMLERFGTLFTAEQLEEAKQQEAAMLTAAVDDVWMKLADPVTHLIEVLRKADDGQHKRWHDSLITNIVDAARAASALNFTGSEELAQIAEDMLVELGPVQKEHLKNNPATRADVRAKAEALRERMSGFLPMTQEE
jgi:hypothetical protein